MAAGVPGSVNLGVETECSVCREAFKDPRVLECGHYFCRGCLEGILLKDPGTSIKCPNCRAETQVTTGSGVKGLQRPYMETLQEQLAALLSKNIQSDISRNCHICADKQVPAAVYCYGCKVFLCESCHNKHDVITKAHKCVSSMEYICCSVHTNEVIVFFCKDCNQGMCTFCALCEHAGHQSVDIADLSKQCRQRLQDYIDSQPPPDKNESTLKHVRSLLERARHFQSEFQESMSTTRRLLRQLEDKLDQVERDTKDKMAAEIKTLLLYESDIKDLIDSRQSLTEHATYLVESASDPEVVEKEKDFPKTSFANLQYIDNASVELPMLDKPFEDTCSKLQHLIADCSVEFITSNTTGVNIKELKKVHTVKITHNVDGLLADVKRQRFVARTRDSGGPLKAFDFKGQLVDTFGSGVGGLSDCVDKGLAVDTKRDLYMAPCDSSLVLVNPSGQHDRSIRVGSSGNRGVAYGIYKDVYLVSDIGTHCVYMIDPTSAQVTRQFGSHGTGPTQFNNPYKIHMGTVAGIGRSCIVVNDFNNHCIKVFDTLGNLFKTYGSQGSGERQVSCPFGVTTCPRDRLVVCDYPNKRIVSFWTDDAGQDHWENLIDNDWGGSYPWLVAIDTMPTVMCVTDGTRQVLHIYA